MTDPTQKTGDPAETQLDRLDELLSCHFDDRLSEKEITELNELLASDPAARTRTVEVAQLHADLTELFRGESTNIAPALPLVPGVPSIDQPIG